ncbi:hypothetical protein BGZ49_003281 [Haplosporangium sp. Z 27]|nr:hypothetical protein BGZ49_003281 [Haplosporangium sp. Z 27]
MLDSLFHKDTHLRHLPKHQQQQIKDREKKYRQQLQLRQAHEEYNRQRELHARQQQFQQQQLLLRQHQQQHQHQQPLSITPTSTTSPQILHHHHHHHHYHVVPLVGNLNSNTSSTTGQLNSIVTSVPANHENLSLASPAATPLPSPSPSSSPLIAAAVTSSTSSSTSNSSPPLLLSSANLHHHHHSSHGSTIHQLLPQRPNQFSDWTNVKERERARLLSNVARARSTQPPTPSPEDAKENLRRLSQRIHQRRTRTRETILYDLHQGVKSVEAQVQKQVDMVLGKLKDAPGSKYAFALTHTFLTQLPQALSNTILPSAISAVADTVAGRTTNSLTTLRGRAGLDEFDEEDEDDDEDEDDEMDDLDDPEDLGYQQQIALMRLYQQQDSGVSQQLSSDFRTIALASPPMSPSDSNEWSSNSVEGSSYNTKTTGSVSISSAGASEFLAASTQHNYSSAATQVLNAALPSFIPSMVAPIVCVFSYPSNSKGKDSSAKGKEVAPNREPEHRFQESGDCDGVKIKQEEYDFDLQAAIKADPAIASVTSTAWTSAEREALFLAATRFRLRGQWSKIRKMMCLHRTDKEIEDEYQRLYGESADEDDDSDVEGMEGIVDDKSMPIKQEQPEDVLDGTDADDEAEQTEFMRFEGQQRGGSTLVPQEATPYLMEIQALPVASTPSAPRSRSTGHQAPGHQHHSRHNKQIQRTLKEKPLKEFMVDKRFKLEEIPMQL